ncbi:outer membrane receptor for ferrienterochelin and colicin [Pseudoalteromonas sp. MBR-15]|jgi:outer membrane receptor for ferrienterochelin and colicin
MKIQLRKTALSLAIAACVGVSGAALANDTSSSIKGQISGPSGNPAANTKLVIIHEPTGTKRVVSTNESGTFNATGLRVGGPYKITIDSDVYQDVELDNIYLSLGETRRLDQALSTTNMESIVVTGSPVFFNSSANDSYYGSETIKNTPSIGRDIKDIVRNNPLVVVQPGSSSSMSIAGSNPRTNSITVDGIPLNDDFGLNGNGYPTQRNPFPLDALDQVSVSVAPVNAKSSGFTGGNVDAVFKSGTNEVHGSVFYEKLSSDWAGTPKDNGQDIELDFEEKNYGASFGAPLIKDTLFFFGAYEKFESPQQLEFGPGASSIGSNKTTATLADLEAVQKIANDVYGVDFIGTTDLQPQLEDEKYIAKVDWNINDYHRANFIYMHNEGNNTNNMTSSSRELRLSTHWYNKAEELDNYSTTLYSDWSDDFSTQFSLTKKSVETSQASLNGDLGLGDITIRNLDVDGDGKTGSIAFGSDEYRHSNSLSNDLFTVKFDGTYLYEEHSIDFGLKYDVLDIENQFLPASKGVITFDSIEDFENRVVSRYKYINGTGNDPSKVTAKFSRKDIALYINDTWDYSDNLKLSAGLRYERLGSDDKPIYNAKLEDTTGYDNTTNLDGLDIFLPRAGFTYYLNDDVTLRGSVGRYSGGNPNVWISNSYSNDGISKQTYQNEDFTAPNTILNNPTQDAIDAINVSTEGSVANLIDPDFEMPSQWTYMLNADVELDIPYLGDGFAWTSTAIYTKKENSPEWINASLLQEGDVVGSTSDGSLPFYDTSELNIMLTNADKEGRSIILSTGISKTWDNGVSFDASYTHQDITDGNPGASSTAASNYRYGHFGDHQQTQIGTSPYETEHRFVLNLGYTAEFIENYKTNFNLFFERRSGSAYSQIVDLVSLPGGGNFNQDLIQPSGFETYGGNYPVYVPTANDPNVMYSDGVTEAQVLEYFEQLGLSGSAGSVVNKNNAKSPWVTTMDLYVSQEVPGFTKDHRGEVYFVIDNLLNLIDSSKGKVYTQSNNTSEVIQMDIDPTTGKYIFGSPVEDGYSFEAEDSTYRIKLGVRYTF